jgi:hypothetical protein
MCSLKCVFSKHRLSLLGLGLNTTDLFTKKVGGIVFENVKGQKVKHQRKKFSVIQK